ncbi:MAG: hypothetical protein WD398_13865 [Cyclobacteriaceae bacterium]
MLSIIILVNFSQCSPPPEKIIFPENLKTYQVADSIPFMDILEEYDQDIPVIIVITTQDKDKIIQTLKEYEFPYPFIHDPDGLFKEENQLWQRFGLKEKNTIASFFMQGDYISKLGPAQIGMRQLFREQLDEFLR